MSIPFSELGTVVHRSGRSSLLFALVVLVCLLTVRTDARDDGASAILEQAKVSRRRSGKKALQDRAISEAVQSLRESASSVGENATSKAPVHVCWLLHAWATQYVAVQHFAITDNAHRFPHLAISSMMLGSNVSGPLAQQIASGMIPALGNCTVVFGPGWSSIAASISPLVDAPLWIGASETATALSNTVAYPHFNRVIPSDEEGSIAVVHLLKHFKWTTVNTFCAESEYGKSFISGFAKLAIRSGIRVDLQRCYLVTASDEEIDEYLIALRDTSRSRVVVSAVDSALMVRVVPRIKALGLDTVLTFVFSENACTGVQMYWLELPGSFCASFLLNETRREVFQERYWARTDRLAVEHKFKSVNVFETSRFKYPKQQQPVTAYHGFYHDAAMFALTALEGYYASIAKNNSNILPDAARVVQPPRNTILSEWARSKKSELNDGITGAVWLDSKGDRSSFRAAALNVVGNQSSSSSDGSPGTARTFAVIAEDGAVMSGSVLPFFVGVGESATAPSHLTPRATPPVMTSESSANTTMLLLGAAVFAALLAAIIVGVIIVLCWRKRRFDRIPMDPASPFATFFVSVSNEGSVRDAFGADVSKAACRKVEGIIDSCAAAERCHVARRLDAHFMVVSVDPQRALSCITAIRKATAHIDWSAVANSALSKSKELMKDPNTKLKRTSSDARGSHAHRSKYGGRPSRLNRSSSTRRTQSQSMIGRLDNPPHLPNDDSEPSLSVSHATDLSTSAVMASQPSSSRNVSPGPQTPSAQSSSTTLYALPDRFDQQRAANSSVTNHPVAANPVLTNPVASNGNGAGNGTTGASNVNGAQPPTGAGASVPEPDVKDTSFTSTPSTASYLGRANSRAVSTSHRDGVVSSRKMHSPNATLRTGGSGAGLHAGDDGGVSAPAHGPTHGLAGMIREDLSNITIDLSIGVSFGPGLIEPPTEGRDAYDFRFTGTVVDDAAHLTDLAGANQILSTHTMFTLSMQLESPSQSITSEQIPFAFERFTETLLPSDISALSERLPRRASHPNLRRSNHSGAGAGSGRGGGGGGGNPNTSRTFDLSLEGPAASVVFQYNPTGLPRVASQDYSGEGTTDPMTTFDLDSDNDSVVSSPTALSSLRGTLIGNNMSTTPQQRPLASGHYGAKVGSLTAALEEASGGLSMRPVAAVVFVIPALFNRSTSPGSAFAVYSALQSAVQCEKGVVLSACDGVVVVAVNAVGPPVPSAPYHAACAARGAIDAVFEETGFVCCAGIDCGIAAVGPTGTTRSPQDYAAKALTCTAMIQRATALAHMALRARFKTSLLDRTTMSLIPSQVLEHRHDQESALTTPTSPSVPPRQHAPQQRTASVDGQPSAARSGSPTPPSPARHDQNRSPKLHNSERSVSPESRRRTEDRESDDDVAPEEEGTTDAPAHPVEDAASVRVVSASELLPLPIDPTSLDASPDVPGLKCAHVIAPASTTTKHGGEGRGGGGDGQHKHTSSGPSSRNGSTTTAYNKRVKNSDAQNPQSPGRAPGTPHRMRRSVTIIDDGVSILPGLTTDADATPKASPQTPPPQLHDPRCASDTPRRDSDTRWMTTSLRSAPPGGIGAISMTGPLSEGSTGGGGRGLSPYDNPQNESGIVFTSPTALHELRLHFTLCAVDICAFRTVGGVSSFASNSKGGGGGSDRGTPSSPSTPHGIAPPERRVLPSLSARLGRASPQANVSLHHSLHQAQFGASLHQARDAQAAPQQAHNQPHQPSHPRGLKGCRPVPVSIVLQRGDLDDEHHDEEWMYQISTAEGSDPFAPITAGVTAIVNGDFAAAEGAPHGGVPKSSSQAGVPPGQCDEVAGARGEGGSKTTHVLPSALRQKEVEDDEANTDSRSACLLRQLVFAIKTVASTHTALLAAKDATVLTPRPPCFDSGRKNAGEAAHLEQVALYAMKNMNASVCPFGETLL